MQRTTLDKEHGGITLRYYASHADPAVILAENLTPTLAALLRDHAEECTTVSAARAAVWRAVSRM